MKCRTSRRTKWRRNYLLIFEGALIACLLLFIGLFRINIPDEDQLSDFSIEKEEVVQSSFLLTTNPPTPTIPPPPPKVAVPVEKPTDHIIEEEITDFDVEFTIEEPLSLPAPEAKGDELNPFKVVDEMPRLIGGATALQERIEYPKKAIRDQVEGRVIIKFIVNKEGTVLDPIVVKGLRDDCDTEALKAVAASKFIPGKQKGKKVAVEYMLHILFQIEYRS